MPRTLTEIRDQLEGKDVKGAGDFEQLNRTQLEGINRILFSAIAELSVLLATEPTQEIEIRKSISQAQAFKQAVDIYLNLNPPPTTTAVKAPESSTEQARFSEFLLSNESTINFLEPGGKSRQEESLLSQQLKTKFSKWKETLGVEQATEKLFEEKEFQLRLRAFVYQTIYLFLERKTDTGKVGTSESPALSSSGPSPYTLEAFLGSFPSGARDLAHELRELIESSVVHHNRAAFFISNRASTTEFESITDKFSSGSENTKFKKEEGPEQLSLSFSGEFLEIARIYFPTTYAGLFPSYELYQQFTQDRQIVGISKNDWDVEYGQGGKNPYRSPDVHVDGDYLTRIKRKYFDDPTNVAIRDVSTRLVGLRDPNLSDQQKKNGLLKIITDLSLDVDASLVSSLGSAGALSIDLQTEVETAITTQADAKKMLAIAVGNLGAKNCRSYLFWTGDVSKLDIDGKAGTGLARVINSGPMGTMGGDISLNKPANLDEDNYYGLHAIGYNVNSASQSRKAGFEPILYRQPFFILPHSWWQNSGVKIRTASGGLALESDKYGNPIPVFVKLANKDGNYGDNGYINWETFLGKNENTYSLHVRFGLGRFKKVSDNTLLPNYRQILKGVSLTSPGPFIERGFRSRKTVLDHLKFDFDGTKLDEGQKWWQYEVQYQPRFEEPHWVYLQFRQEPEYYYEQDARGQWSFKVNLGSDSKTGGGRRNTLGSVDPHLRDLCTKWRDATAKNDKTTETLAYSEINNYIALNDISASMRMLNPEVPDRLKRSMFSTDKSQLHLFIVAGGTLVLNEVERQAVKHFFTRGIKTLTAGSREQTKDYIPPNFTEEQIEWAMKKSGIVGKPSVEEYDEYLWNLARKKGDIKAHPSLKDLH